MFMTAVLSLFFLNQQLTGVEAKKSSKQQNKAAEDKKKIDPYEVLGVDKEATDDQIKKAYRKLSLKWHPDKASGAAKEEAQKKFSEVSEAYSILMDPAAREAHSIGAFTNFQDWEKAKKKGAKARGFFPETGPVEPWLRQELFKGVQDRSKPILILFYASWCTHCQTFAPEYKKVGLELGDDHIVAAIDCEQDQQLCQQEQVQEFPTLRLLTPKPEMGLETWTGALESADAVIEWVRSIRSNDLIALSPSLFRKELLKSDQPWVVAFTSGPWCGPCNQAKTPLRQMASQLQERISVGVIDCSKHESFCQQQQVQLYPVLRVWPPGVDAKKKLNDGRGQDLMMDQNVFMNPPLAAIDLVAKVLKTVLPPSKKRIGGGEGSGDKNAEMMVEHNKEEL